MKYRVLDGLDLDNRAYAAGDTVAIDDDAIAAQLVEAGVIKASEAPPRQEGGKAAVEASEAPPDQEGGKAAVEDGEAAVAGDADQADENGDPDRAARLLAAIGDLATNYPQERQENLKYWTASGKPKTEALEAANGLENVRAAERDAAWEAYLSGKDRQDGGEPDGQSRRGDPPSSGEPDGE